MPPARTATRAHIAPARTLPPARTAKRVAHTYIIYTANLHFVKILTNNMLPFLTNHRNNPIWGIIPPLKTLKNGIYPPF